MHRSAAGFIVMSALGMTGTMELCAQSGPVLDGLVGYWPFEGEVLLDASGNGHDLLPANPGPECPEGFVPGVMGVSRSVLPCGGLIAEDPAVFDQLSTLSVSLWINPAQSQQQTYSAVVYRANRKVDSPSVGWSDRTMAIFWTPGGLHFTYTTEAAGWQTECVNHHLGLEADTWHHVAATIDGAAQTAKLYANGEWIASCEMVAPLLMAGTEALVFGSTYNPQLWDSGGFTGAIDQVRYYDRALSDLEVRQVYRYECCIFKDGFEK